MSAPCLHPYYPPLPLCRPCPAQCCHCLSGEILGACVGPAVWRRYVAQSLRGAARRISSYNFVHFAPNPLFKFFDSRLQAGTGRFPLAFAVAILSAEARDLQRHSHTDFALRALERRARNSGVEAIRSSVNCLQPPLLRFLTHFFYDRDQAQHLGILE